MEKMLKPGKPIRTRELTEFGPSRTLPAGTIALNAIRGAFCLALNRAVGGKSKSGAMTITSIIAINNKLTTLAQRFIVTTRDNSMFRHMLIIKYREAGQPWHACIALASP
jgi:hypothetical protein